MKTSSMRERLIVVGFRSDLGLGRVTIPRPFADAHRTVSKALEERLEALLRVVNDKPGLTQTAACDAAGIHRDHRTAARTGAQAHQPGRPAR